MNIEKLIEHLETDAIATDTGYVEVLLFLFSEIINSLKEKKSERKITQDGVRCGNCNRLLRYDSLFCDKCGRKIISDV